MQLISPDFGLIFWMILSFVITFFILAKFAFPAINKMLKRREQKINEALETAKRTQEEMKNIQANNELLIQKAHEESEKILSETYRTRNKFLEDAKTKASEEANLIIENAKKDIENERAAVMTDIKNEIADISIKVAEKILEKHLYNNDKEQLDYINKLLQDIENKNRLAKTYDK